jgi:hypothetical protein
MPVDASIDPQLGLHVLPSGLALPHEPFATSAGKALQIVVLEPTTGCITCQFRPTGGPLARLAVNWICCAGLKPTGAVALEGDTATRIPESRETTAAPVLPVLAAAADVKVIVGMGFGKLDKAGAVYDSVLFTVLWFVVHVPMDPPFTVCPLVQFAGLVVLGLGFDCVGAGVYTYVQLHVELRFVEPVTVAVNTCVVVATTAATAGLTVTTTWFAPDPPQLEIHATAPATSMSMAALLIALTFMTNVSLICSTRISRPRPYSLCVRRMPKNHFAAAYLKTSGLP